MEDPESATRSKAKGKGKRPKQRNPGISQRNNPKVPSPTRVFEAEAEQQGLEGEEGEEASVIM